MTEFFDVAIANAFRQILGGFGLMFLFAFLMWTMSQRRRGVGGGKFGNSYYYFVAPGVMFHELGHALGCLLTMTKITRFVPFHPKGDRLGYVAYAMPVGARFGAIRIFIISTGPVWLGCFVITLLGWILGGNGRAGTHPADCYDRQERQDNFPRLPRADAGNRTDRRAGQDDVEGCLRACAGQLLDRSVR